MRVFITSCETGEGAWRTHEEQLKRFYELSDKKHRLASSPDSADIVLIGNVREENWGQKILDHELINKDPGKCFSITDADAPLTLHHGIYASGRKTILSFGRVRTGSYTAYYDDYLNPFVKAHMHVGQHHLEKKYLFSFIGRNSNRLRDVIFRLTFRRTDILVQDSSTAFDLWSVGRNEGRLERQKYYYNTLLGSKFSLCPRGAGASSLRLFESLQLGVAPVIISDRWIFPRGPRWRDFSILLKEKHARGLEKIVQSYETSYEEMGSLARNAFETYFSDDVYFNYIVENCVDINKRQWIPEALYWKLNPVVIALLKVRAELRPRIGRLLQSLGAATHRSRG